MKKQWIAFLLAFALPILGVFWWWGAFSKAEIETAQRGPYHYAYTVHKGDYSKLPERQQEVWRALEAQGIAPGASVTLLLNDPRTTPKRDWSAQVGALVPPEAKVAEPLRTADIPSRKVLTVRVKGQPLLAPGKAYAALVEYLEQHGMKFNLPTLEIYQDGVLSVEMSI